MDSKIKHLELIQGIINRFGSNSFLLKGWCVTLVSALLALSSKDVNVKLVYVTYLPILMFWILDAYFLWQERLFRKLYDKIRTLNIEQVDFSMNVASFMDERSSWSKVFFSKTLLIFYLTMFVSVIIVTYLLIFS